MGKKTDSQVHQRRKILKLDGKSLDIKTIKDFLEDKYQGFELTKQACAQVQKARTFVEEILQAGQPIYGVNTGFGKLASQHIPAQQLEELQLNLIRSHACGTGNPFQQTTVRLAILLRINSLSRGHSGVRLELLEALLALLNKGITPWVPERGSVGASGDLAPLSHIALVLVGEGRAYYKGKLLRAKTILKKAKISPIKLQAKEGIALINGTQFVHALGLQAFIEASTLAKLADLSGALTLEALRGTDQAFDQRIAEIRPHPGHAKVANNLRLLMKGSKIRESHRENDPRVQDPYSLRCMPQVHGAVRDTLDFAENVLSRELEAVTDNPLLFPQDKTVLSGGNFHAEPLALVLDYMAIALSELANIAERRIEQMVNPDLSELPPFLVNQSGLHSGMMISHVTAAALASENKVYAHPASVDSIPTSANKEDHVSMGISAGLKLQRILLNLRTILEIELLCARYGLEYHLPLRPGKLLMQAFQVISAKIPPLKGDRRTYEDFEKMTELIKTKAFSAILNKLY